MRRKTGSARGFTLIEVLVAFAIAALSLAAILQIFGTGLRNAAVSEDYARATMLAESRLAGIGLERPIEAGESSGVDDDGFRWSVVIRPYQEADLDAAIEIFEVSVRVAWGEAGERERSVKLSSLRLGAAQ